MLRFAPAAVDETGLLTLSWTGAPERRYRVEYSEDELTTFGVLVSNVANPSLQNQVVDGGPTGRAFRAYRIVLEDPP